MREHTLVCPFDDSLLRRLGSHSVAVEVECLDDVKPAFDLVCSLPLRLHSILATSSGSLADTRIRDDWRHIPLALTLPGMGRLREAIDKIRALRSMNTRLYLVTGDAESFVAPRILASLGVETAVVFARTGVDWEAAADLMTYALLGQRPNAGIQPFAYLAHHYQPTARTDFGAPFYDDPRKFVHLDSRGRVALSRAERDAGTFIAEDACELDELAELGAYRDRLDAWQKWFLETDGCAYCEGWRVCQARAVGIPALDGSCRAFFSELMDVVEQHRERSEGKLVVWQP